jgi:hypothetical protein
VGSPSAADEAVAGAHAAIEVTHYKVSHEVAPSLCLRILQTQDGDFDFPPTPTSCFLDLSPPRVNHHSKSEKEWVIPSEHFGRAKLDKMFGPFRG